MDTQLKISHQIFRTFYISLQQASLKVGLNNQKKNFQWIPLDATVNDELLFHTGAPEFVVQ